MSETTAWPDLSKDRKAWALAKNELGPKASTREIAVRAQEIKEKL